MNNLLYELKTIVSPASDERLSLEAIRIRLKEVLHAFVLDCIYNSGHASLVFYGGTCLRILYGLPRLSEDLDFEGNESHNMEKLAKILKDYFSGVIRLRAQVKVKRENNVSRINLSFPLLYELGLSPHSDETIRVKVEVRPVSSAYLHKLPIITTPVIRYGRSFITHHYDLPTLFASKLAAILQRPQKGFRAGKPEERIDFKGRDFYDLDWYMQQGILPNETMLRLNNIDMSVGEVFDQISIFLATRDMKPGLKRDLLYLLRSQGEVESFAETFRERFSRLKAERYTPKKITSLDAIFLQKNLIPGAYWINFQYRYEGGIMPIDFLFHISEYFMCFGKGAVDLPIDQALLKKIRYLSQIENENVDRKLHQYVALFYGKIGDYLKRHKNEVYFSEWRSKFIRMGDESFNPEKEITFARGKDLLNKAVTLESL